MASLLSADTGNIPPGAFLGIPADNLPAFHGGLTGYPAELRRLVEFLNGTNFSRAQRPYYSLVQTASGVWQAPVLALSVNPAWHAANQRDAALHGTACPSGK